MPPVDDLIRAVFTKPPELRTGTGGAPPILAGHFAVFNEWTEIDSFWEGSFLEQLARGAFKKTISENLSQVKVLYDHGYDPQLGNKPLGPIDQIREDNIGCYYEVPLIDTSYNRDFVIPAAEAGLLGASFRFKVIQDAWNDEPGVSAYNPKGLPERTIKEVRLYEFGPVTFPAYAAATAGLRSKLAFDLWRGLDETDRSEFARFVVRAQKGPVGDELTASTSGSGAGVPWTTRATPDPEAARSTDVTPAPDHAHRTPKAERRRRVLELK